MSRTTVTTATLTMLSSTYISSGLTQALFSFNLNCQCFVGSVGCGFRRGFAMGFVNFSQFGAIATQCAGGEEGVLRRQHKVATCRWCGRLDRYQLRPDIVAREQGHPLHLLARHEALDLIKDRVGMEGADLGLDLPRGEPDCVPVGLTGVRAAGLPGVGA